MMILSQVKQTAQLAPFSLRRFFSQALKTVAVSTGLVAGLVGTLSPVSLAQPNSTTVRPATVFPENGVYLYGQSAQPDQLGKAYMVFEVKNGKMIGAFYMPSSSFDCFYGQVQEQKLALTVIDSYAQTAHPYAVALERNQVISSQTPMLGSFSLQGFHPISKVSANDQRILQVCRQQHGNQL